MGIGRIVKTAIKYGPIAYPIIRKAMNKRKAGSAPTTTPYKTNQPKR
ncbi:hypothetical protein [Planococcus shixiaomingii]|nr:hypothetical protein [Planococcus sp. N022]WKA55807.1 hypothetical protein QWY21_05305 [Planococcus sp. N022]